MCQDYTTSLWFDGSGHIVRIDETLAVEGHEVQLDDALPEEMVQRAQNRVMLQSRTDHMIARFHQALDN